MDINGKELLELYEVLLTQVLTNQARIMSVLASMEGVSETDKQVLGNGVGVTLNVVKSMKADIIGGKKDVGNDGE